MTNDLLQNPWKVEDIDRLTRQPGQHVGCFVVPTSSNDSAWGAQVGPIMISSAQREGPRVLITAGIHGDEYEGPVVLAGFVSNKQLEVSCGSVAVVPVVNTEAFAARQRHSPTDLLNLNRAFSHTRIGSQTGDLAAFLKTLVNHFDVVIDLHTGGASLEFAPSVIWHASTTLRGSAESGRLASHFGARFAFAVDSVEPDGTLDNYAALNGKVAVAAELGGGGRLCRERVTDTENCIHCALDYLGMKIAGAGVIRARQSPVAMKWPNLLRAHVAGLLEAHVDLGTNVNQGQRVGVIHQFCGLEYKATSVFSSWSGTIVAIRSLASVKLGDTMFAIAEDVGEAPCTGG